MTNTEKRDAIIKALKEMGFVTYDAATKVGFKVTFLGVLGRATSGTKYEIAFYNPVAGKAGHAATFAAERLAPMAITIRHYAPVLLRSASVFITL